MLSPHIPNPGSLDSFLLGGSQVDPEPMSFGWLVSSVLKCHVVTVIIGIMGITVVLGKKVSGT